MPAQNIAFVIFRSSSARALFRLLCINGIKSAHFFDSPVEITNNHERILLRYGNLLKIDSRRISRELVNL
jgi:hypothetical protein